MQNGPAVRVNINGSLDPSARKAFSDTDQALANLKRTTNDLTGKMNDVGAYRRQQNAVKEVGAEWKAAKAKAKELRDEIAASENPTRKQTAALARAEAQVTRTSRSYQDAKTKLGEMNRALQQQGVNVGRLSDEYKRLKAAVDAAKAAEERHAALRRQVDRESIQRQQRLDDVIRRQQQAHARNTEELRRQQAQVETIRKSWEQISGFAVGAAAAAVVVARPTMQAADYEKKVTDIADTFAWDKDVAGRNMTKAEVEKSIDAANIPGGTKREELADALGMLAGAGQVSKQQSLEILPDLSKTAFALSTLPSDIAQYTNASTSFGVTDMPLAYDQLLRSGQLGGYEAKAVARYIPQQQALAQQVGYSGQEGNVQLLAMNQAVRRVSGNEEEAGRNVINLLQKLSSRELKDRLEDLIIPEAGDGLPTKKMQKGSGKTAKMVDVFDWTKYIQMEREKGVYPAEAMAKLIDAQLSKNPDYMALKKRLAESKTKDEYNRTLSDMNNQATGSMFGDFFTDRQALLGAIGYANARGPQTGGAKTLDELLLGIRDARGAVGKSYDFKGQQTYATMATTGELVKKAQYDSYQSFEDTLGKALVGVNNLAIEFPKLAQAAYSATIALAGLATFMVAKGFVAGGAAGGAAAGAAVAGGAATAARYLGPMGMAGIGGYNAYSAYNNPALSRNEKKTEYSAALWGTAGGVGGMMAGAKVGAAAGAFTGPLAWIGVPAGAVIGGALGGYGGYKLGDAGGRAIADKALTKDPAEIQANQAAATAAQQAAQAAQAAATAATIKPNMTNNFNTSLNTTINEAADPKAFSLELGAQLNAIDRQRAAEARALYPTAPEF